MNAAREYQAHVSSERSTRSTASSRGAAIAFGLLAAYVVAVVANAADVGWAGLADELLAGREPEPGDEAPRAVLTPLTALEEIVATATSLIEGRSDIPAADRASLGQDVSASFEALGRSTAASASAVLRSFQAQDLGPLPRLLKERRGSAASGQCRAAGGRRALSSRGIAYAGFVRSNSTRGAESASPAEAGR